MVCTYFFGAEVLRNLEYDDPEVHLWRNEIFSYFPRRFAQRIAREYEEKLVFDGEQAANLYLLAHRERVRKGCV